MPTYDLKCLKCQNEFERISTIAARHEQKCVCGGVTVILFKKPSALVMFRAGYYPDVGPDGTWAETPQQLQDACNEHGKYSEYLENSCTFKVRKDYDAYDESQDQARQRKESEPLVVE